MKNTGKERWLALWKRLGAKGDPYVVYADLAMRYSEPQRAYHTLGHIMSCLDEFDRVRRFATNPNAVELAIWFHDAFYETRTKDNEEWSAALAADVLRKAGLPEEFRAIVVSLVVATKHLDAPVDPDTQLLVDIDLSILGKSEREFNSYEWAIRQEYSWVPEKTFAAKRAKILKSFLDRSNIYLTQVFRKKYEVAAQKNIARSFAQLKSQGRSS